MGGVGFQKELTDSAGGMGLNVLTLSSGHSQYGSGVDEAVCVLEREKRREGGRERERERGGTMKAATLY